MKNILFLILVSQLCNKGFSQTFKDTKGVSYTFKDTRGITWLTDNHNISIKPLDAGDVLLSKVANLTPDNYPLSKAAKEADADLKDLINTKAANKDLSDLKMQVKSLSDSLDKYKKMSGNIKVPAVTVSVSDSVKNVYVSITSLSELLNAAVKRIELSETFNFIMSDTLNKVVSKVNGKLDTSASNLYSYKFKGNGKDTAIDISIIPDEMTELQRLSLNPGKRWLIVSQSDAEPGAFLWFPYLAVWKRFVFQ